MGHLRKTEDHASAYREKTTYQQISRCQPYNCADRQNVTACVAAAGIGIGIRSDVAPVEQASNSTANNGALGVSDSYCRLTYPQAHSFTSSYRYTPTAQKLISSSPPSAHSKNYNSSIHVIHFISLREFDF